MSAATPHILSIQSSVAWGHVGNSAAMFPLQRLGAAVSAIHTVQFSNHTGYGDWTGTVFPGDSIGALVDGLARRDVLGTIDAVLTGYVGDPATGAAMLDAVDRVRARNDAALYALDPVFGDVGRGVFARPGVVEFFADRALGAADVATPNQFELETLCATSATTLDAAKTAATALRARLRPDGPRTVLVTSLDVEDRALDAVELLVAADDGFHRLRTPRLAIAPNGAGDVISALFLLHLLRSGDPVFAMAAAASAVWGVLNATMEAGARELALVAAQEELVSPSRRFRPEPC